MGNDDHLPFWVLLAIVVFIVTGGYDKANTAWDNYMGKVHSEYHGE